MIISNFVAYVKQMWKNKPDTSTPLSADRLLHIEDGIKGNSDAIEAIAAAVVSQIVNDPDKIASMAALYAVDKKIGNVADLPNSAADVVTAITQQNSNLQNLTDNNINVKTFVSSLSGLNANSYGTYTFDASDLNGKDIIGYIPVINYAGNRDLTCKIGSFSDLSAITVDVKNNETSSLTYGNIRLHILYK